MPFRIALSGLNAASADLKVTGHNIANSATTGFKQSRSEFADVFALSYGGISRTAVGAGVRLAAVTQQFGQGNIDFTGNNLDLAINGRGFFVMSDQGVQVYSRAGAFQVDRDGYVVNSDGLRLQGFQPIDEGGALTTTPRFNTGGLSDIRIDTIEAPPRATTEVQALLNLRSDDPQPDNTGFVWNTIDPNAVPPITAPPNAYNYTTSMTMYDSLGQAHTATYYFVSQLDDTVDPPANPLDWTAHMTIDGRYVGEEAITFQPDGTLDQGAGYDTLDFGGGLVNFDPENGADPLNVSVDLSGMTQYGSSYTVNALRQDGNTTGRLASVDIDESGVVYARYTNGTAEALGKVALANFQNPQGLQQLGDNSWAQSFAAGEALIGEAGSGDFGQIQSGGLETSNVDIAAQLVNLITAQRNFQANAQVIQTADAVTQTIINIR
jgi:flagellar hook protein FlgE